MNFKQIDKAPKTFILVFKTGDELAKGLSKFAEEQKLSAASFKAVGALSSVRLGWYSWESKKYEPSVTLDEQIELLSLIGDVALYEGKPVVHAHAVVAKKMVLRTVVIFLKRTSGRHARWCSRKAPRSFKNALIPTLASL